MTKKYKCRVEYLESTGTQYIDTGVIGNGEFNVKYGLYANSIGSSSDIFAGARSSTQHLNFGQAANNGQFTLGYLNQYWQELSNFAINTRYDIEISYKSGEQYAIINGTKGSSKTYTGTEQTDLTIYLFKRHHYGTDNVGGLQGRIYYFTIKQNDVLVRDMIPVLDNSGRPAMYDQVSGQLFYNQGTGEFTYGRQIIPVEYLESTGTQYIDTGLKGKNNIDFDYKCIFTNLDGTAQCVGGNWSGASSSSVSLYLGLIRTNGNFAYHYDGTSSPVVIMNTTVQGTPYSVQGHMWVGEQYMVINGTKSSVGTISNTFTSSLNMYLFGINNNGLSNPAYMKLYYCKIYDNGVLVRDFIPCIDENLTPFMFDKVNGTVYLNAGTGQFKVGPNVEKAWGGKKLRKKLALALATLKKPRKYYCEVEYLESTEQQTNATDTTNASWIDTGIIPDDTTQMECRVAFTTLVSGNNTEALFGSTGASTGNYRFAFGYASISPYTNFYVGLGGQNLTTSLTRDTNVHTFKIDAINKTWAIDDTSGSFTSAGSLASTTSIFLFARHNPSYGDDKANKPSNAKTYYCKIWKGGSLVRDMIPVLDWNMTPCMYDKITEQLFYTQGTKQFSYGREIHPVDYLESTGTQYIDTGYYPNLNTKVEFMASGINADSFAASSSGTWFTGGRQAYQQKMFGSHYNPSNQNLYFSFSTSQNSSYYSSSSMYGDNKKFTLDKTGLYINDVKIVNNTNTTDFTSPATLAIFALNNNGTVISFTGYKLQYYKIWDNNTLLRDFIPAIDENGVGFMFDRVSHTIYDNAGTGAFGYSGREVEYLQSDGARAIVAGVTVDDTCGYDVKWMALNANDAIIMGTKGSGDSRWVLSGSNNPNVNLSWNKSYGSAGLGLNKIQTAQMNYLNDRKRILNDTPLVDITETLLSAASTYNVGIFGGYWGSNTIGLYSTCRIYYAKISKGTGLIRDFVPMVKDGSPCLYDKVGGAYYFGIGSGTFTRGKIVEPEYE